MFKEFFVDALNSVLNILNGAESAKDSENSHIPSGKTMQS
jgi:hypothetical protein